MRRLARINILALATVALAGSSVMAQEDITRLVQNTTPSVVTITAYRGFGSEAGATGFYIAPDQVATNWHVVRNAQRVEVKTRGGATVKVTSIRSADQGADLAILRLGTPNRAVRPLKIATQLPRVGERILVIGSPAGLDYTVSDGIVSAVRQIDDIGPVIQITAPVSPGSSGSPVVNMRGEVVGVVVATESEGQNLNFAVPSQTLIRLQSGAVGSSRSLPAGGGAGPSSAEMAKGQAFVKQRNFTAAIPVFQGVVKSDPDNVEAWLSLGMSYLATDQNQEAASAFGQVIRLRPDLGPAYTVSGVAYQQMGDAGKAETMYKRAIALDPTDSLAHFGLGTIYAGTGRKAEALDEYSILKDLNSDLAARLFEVIYG